MKTIKILLVMLTIAVLAAFFYAPYLDSYDASGTVSIPALSAPVRIVRDDNGIPYIFADQLNDAVLGQGFVIAQDRLFQLQMSRLLGQGRLSELAGDAGIAMDTMVHLLNIPALGRQQAAMLTQQERQFYQSYVDGVNAYLTTRSHELALPFRSNPPPLWTLDELISTQIFNYWASTSNWREELLSQSLIDNLGLEDARQISQITINADDEKNARTSSGYRYQLTSAAALNPQVAAELPKANTSLLDQLPAPDKKGSNAWITGPKKSKSGMPIVASDPHMDARRLPGIFYPIGLITPELRIIGAVGTSYPGIGLGRTNHIAWGLTNGYGDMADLYLEKIDPENSNNYLEGSKSIPFSIREATFRIKDSESDDGFRIKKLRIRSTSRGPIITDHHLGDASGHMMSLRWSFPEFMQSTLGGRDLLLAKNVEQALTALGATAMPLTYVVADQQGNIARTGTGFIPKRRRGDGAAPLPVIDDNDSWDGRIAPAEMPQLVNPKQSWLGSANHRILPKDYPYH